MSSRKTAEFDKFAGSYTQLHATNIKASGEEPSYFAHYKARYMADWFATHRVKSCPAPFILDFGCGIGNTTPHLHSLFPQATLHGVDMSSESVEKARDAHGAISSYTVIDNDRVPYPDQSFDLILAACVFHHIPVAQRNHWMSELRRLLKPQGQLFVFEHNTLNPVTRAAVASCPFDEDAILLPMGELAGLMRETGFSRTGTDYIVFFPRLLAALRPLEKWLGWLPLGAQYVVRGGDQQ